MNKKPKKIQGPRKPVLGPTARKREIARLRALLRHGKFTLTELMSIRGRIGGLVGIGTEGRRLGGRRACEVRWSANERAPGDVPSRSREEKK